MSNDDYAPVITCARDPEGTGRCRYRGCRVAVTPEALVVIANGGDLICQQCMGEIIQKHPSEVRGG